MRHFGFCKPYFFRRTRLFLLLCTLSYFISSCSNGPRSDDIPAPPPPPVQPSSIAWSNESATFLATPSRVNNGQLPININGSILNLTLSLSSSLQPFLTVPQINNLQSGTTQIPITINVPNAAQLGIVAGTIQASAPGTTSTMNIYLNVWTEQTVPGLGLFLTIPPNLMPTVNSDSVVYRDPQSAQGPIQPAAFSVREFQNPQDLTLRDFIAQQKQLDDSQNVLPVLSPYDAAQSVESISASNAIEAVMFRKIPDYVLHDVAYIRFNKRVIVISDVTLDTPFFDQMVQTARPQ